MSAELLNTPLHDWHAAHGGRMVEFGGWSMPVQYGSIVDEHRATRTAVGLFDISHMGRLRFDGPGAMPFLDSLLTRRVDNLAEGRIRYSLMTNDAGGVLDDVLVYRLAEPDGTPYYMLVVNAGNRLKIVDWIMARSEVGGRRSDAGETPLSFRKGPVEGERWRVPTTSTLLSNLLHLTDTKIEFDDSSQLDGVKMTDLTLSHGMIAVQGPAALKVMQPLVNVELTAMKYYSAAHGRIGETSGLVSRTGYTGEDGVELIVPAAELVGTWEHILAAGQTAGAVAVGLGARDTLRLEAAMPLYGHELTEEISPYQAGLDFAVDLDDAGLDARQFPGRDALAAIRNQPDLPRRVGLECASGRVPREGCPVLAGGVQVGHVTSGTFSPTLDCPIAMAYVAPQASAVGNEVIVDIRGKPQAARVVQLPFYTRPQR
ncbi:MAG: glycine cleavage system protein T [Planctomycetia bacterium]|nr:glycine cleavage system protein T [Planctomycetia bacterium]